MQFGDWVQLQLFDSADLHAHFLTLRMTYPLSCLVSSTLNCWIITITKTSTFHIVFMRIKCMWRTVSVPSKCSVNVTSVTKGNPFLLLTHDTLMDQKKRSNARKPMGKVPWLLRWNHMLKEALTFPLIVVGSGYYAWSHLALSLRLKATLRMIWGTWKLTDSYDK